MPAIDFSKKCNIDHRANNCVDNREAVCEDPEINFRYENVKEGYEILDNDHFFELIDDAPAAEFDNAEGRVITTTKSLYPAAYYEVNEHTKHPDHH